MNCSGTCFGHASTTRCQIACAAVTEICWPTTERASVAIDEMHGTELRDQLLEYPVALDEVRARAIPVRGPRNFRQQAGRLHRLGFIGMDSTRLADDLAFVLRIRHEHLHDVSMIVESIALRARGPGLSRLRSLARAGDTLATVASGNAATAVVDAIGHLG
jgi:hypothetical protein